MEKIAAYDALKPQQYGVIERLELALADMTRYPASEQDLVLELRPFASVDRRRLTLVFRTVRKLRFTQPWMTMFQIGPLRIRSNRTDQLEDMNYEVSESEHDSLAFVCKDFEFELSEVNAPASR